MSRYMHSSPSSHCLHLPHSCLIPSHTHTHNTQTHTQTHTHTHTHTHTPPIHLQVYPLCVFEPLEVGCHFSILLGARVEHLQTLHKLDALVITAAHKRLFSHLQVQVLQGELSQKAPVQKGSILFKQLGYYKSCHAATSIAGDVKWILR